MHRVLFSRNPFSLWIPNHPRCYCKQVDCQACISNPGVGGGLLHQRSGALYRGTCKLCAAVGRSTVYHGESGYNGYTRIDDHGGDIKAGNLSNAFAKHLTEDHPEATAMEIQTAIKFEVLRTFEKPLERQVAEAVAIQNCKADRVLNSKAEWEQPAVERLIVTRELPDQGERRGAACEIARVMFDSDEKRRALEVGSTWLEMHWILEEEWEAEAL